MDSCTQAQSYHWLAHELAVSIMNSPSEPPECGRNDAILWLTLCSYGQICRLLMLEEQLISERREQCCTYSPSCSRCSQIRRPSEAMPGSTL